MNNSGSILGGIMTVVGIILMVMLVVFIVVTIGSTVGTLWGAGNATVNYVKSFKEVVYDGNVNKKAA